MINVGDKVKTNDGLIHVVDNFSDESKPCRTVGKFHPTKVAAI